MGGVSEDFTWASGAILGPGGVHYQHDFGIHFEDVREVGLLLNIAEGSKGI